MTKALLLIGILIMPFGLRAQSPTDSGRRVAENAVGPVINEDRGYAYIITAESQPCFTNSKKSTSLPVQYSIFLGDGWSSDALRTLEPSLSNLFAAPQTLQDTELRGMDIASSAGQNPFHESPSGTGGGNISDLMVQQQIRDVIGNNSAPRITSDMIVVVYLDTGFHSRLAELEGGKHFVAYSNAFNTEGSRIRYIVVPLDITVKGAGAAARKAFLCTVFGS